MAEYGTKEFTEFWRVRGFFAAVDSSKGHGKYTPDGLRRAASVVIQYKIAEMRKELGRALAVVERLDHTFTNGTRGGRVEQTQVEASMIEVAERMRSAADLHMVAKWWMTEAGHRRSWIHSEPEGGASRPSSAPI